MDLDQAHTLLTSRTQERSRPRIDVSLSLSLCEDSAINWLMGIGFVIFLMGFLNNVNCGMKNLLKSLKCIPDCMFLLWGCGEMKNAILSSSFFFFWKWRRTLFETSNWDSHLLGLFLGARTNTGWSWMRIWIWIRKEDHSRCWFSEEAPNQAENRYAI